MTFFWLQKLPSEKSPFLVEHAWEQMMFTIKKIGAIDIKIPLDIFNMQMLRKKKRLRIDLIFTRLRTFFFRTLIPVILFPETLFAAPILF